MIQIEKSIDVLTFGDLCVDLILSGRDVTPEFGQKEKLIENYFLEMGGSCSIFACQTARLGLRTVVLGKVGKDDFGRFIIETLDKAGVSTQYIKEDPLKKTGITTALNTGNDRAMLTYSGTIDAVEYEDVGEELLKSVRHFHIGSYFLMKRIQPYYPEILRKLKKYGATISLDTNWDPEEIWDSGVSEILQLIDIIFLNENEAMAITKANSVEKAIENLKQTIPIVAVKKGKDGALVYAGGNMYPASAIPMETVDAVGAGDTFDGGFIYGFLRGRTIRECAEIACTCGSLNTRAAGGIKGQPALEELMRVMQDRAK